MAGLENVITFDMGGTSCDVALIQHGQPVITDRGKIGERHVAVPMLDINTVSAGGGTLAYVDELGGLHVGPRSAGARPGPACYGFGGTTATVTDADVVLGYLNPVSLLGGAFKVDAEAARRAVREVAEPLGVDVLRAADGIVRVVNVKMTEAIKAISTERGFDLREFSLIAFGGAGPVHACQIALDIGIPRVLVPPAPGATSALGLLMSDVKHDFIRSRLENIENINVGNVNALFGELADGATAQLEAEGFARSENVRLRYFMDMRYAGQGYENPVPIDNVPLTADDLQRYRKRFDDIHRQCHGHAAPGQPVEVVSYRLEAIGQVPRVRLAELEPATDDAKSAQIGERLALFTSASEAPVPVPVYARERLRAGHSFGGPAIVEQYDATTVVCPGQVVRVDTVGNLHIEVA
jgi:N-methylhydantoinase A